MIPSTKHLTRYRQLARLLWKYGRSDLVKQMGHDQLYDANDEEPPQLAEGEHDLPAQLADDLEALGPTYVKLGQVLSSRPDILPKPYLEALARLQNKVKPFPYEDVEAIVQAELGARISKAFSFFDKAPMAAASLGQVHRAALRDGREVVVKVQRPNIVPQVADDFEVLAQIAAFLDKHTEAGRRHRFGEILEEFRLTIQQELDYEREAQNLEAMAANLADFDLITVPLPIRDYCTRRVLTMEYVSGVKIDKIGPVARLEMNGCALAEQLFKAYLKQVLVDGLFHADPHPGNVFITEDERVALLDLGMVGRTTPSMQDVLLKLLVAVSEGKSEQAAELIVQMSDTEPNFDRALFTRRVNQVINEQQGLSLQQINVGRTLLDVVGVAAEVGIYVPSQLSLLAKTLLQLDEVGKILDPEFDPNAAIRRNAGEIASRKMNKSATPGSILTSVMEMKEFAAGLPGRVNKILDAVGNHEMEMKLRVMDTPLVMEGLQKIANRITSGLVLAAMIIGAALLMRVETDFRIGGYPGLAILCFLGAAAGGVWLLFNIFVQDQRSARKAEVVTTGRSR